MIKDGDRVYEVTAFPSSSTTRIMDEFTKLDEEDKPVYDYMRLSIYSHGFYIGEELRDVEFIISRKYPYGENVDCGAGEGITFSQMMKGRYGAFCMFLKKQFPTPEDFLNKVSDYKDFYFEKPFLFRAQSSYQRGKGSTLGGLINYGNANRYVIIGMNITYPYHVGGAKRKSYYILYRDEVASE